MIEIFLRIWENLIERTEGPMNLRFVLQPTMSLIFAIRAGIRDSKNGTVPYLWRFIYPKEEREHIAREGWKDFGKIFIIGVTLDIIYQLLVIFSFKTEAYFYPLESFIVAFLLAILPYLLFRGPVNRLISMFTEPKKAVK